MKSDPTSAPGRWKQRLRAPAAVAAFGYWLALVVATHWPSAPSAVSHNDKLVHFLAYGVLATAIATCGWLHRPLNWQRWLAIVLIVAVLGALDEITQIPFGRTADAADWLADVSGAASAVLLLAAASLVFGRRQAAMRGAS